MLHAFFGGKHDGDFDVDLLDGLDSLVWHLNSTTTEVHASDIGTLNGREVPSESEIQSLKQRTRLDRRLFDFAQRLSMEQYHSIVWKVGRPRIHTLHPTSCSLRLHPLPAISSSDHRCYIRCTGGGHKRCLCRG